MSQTYKPNHPELCRIVGLMADLMVASDSQGTIHPSPSPTCLRGNPACAQVVLRSLPSSSARRGLIGWVGLESGHTARISRCGALQLILSLSAGAERGSELVCRFLGLIPRLMRWLSAARACVKLSLAWSAALSACCVCELVPGPPDGLLRLPVRRSRAFDPCCRF